MTDHERYMKRAIELSEQAAFVEKTGGAFGSVIVDPFGNIVGEGQNRVMELKDPTCHAEMQAIRDAAKRLGTPHLEGCTLYTSAECCPMCLGAAYWAHIKVIYYAATVEDVNRLGNFQDEDMYTEFKKEPEERKIPTHNLLREEAVKVWERFHTSPDRVHY